MRRMVFIILLSAVCFSAWGQEENNLRERLREYLGAMERESAATKCREVDFLISVCTDSLTRHDVANQVYEHYFLSKLMGDDAVAIHIYDKWFSDGTISMNDDGELYAAKFFADINRQSLIGCKAPEIVMQDVEGQKVTVSTNGKYSAVFFYDAECAKCKLESMLLKSVLENVEEGIDFYAIYSGTDEEKWAAYRETYLNFSAAKVNVIHLNDPDLSSNFTTKYGVISTPKLFLVDRSGYVIGRSLDAFSFETLLTSCLDAEILEYGSEEAVALFNLTFSSFEPLTCDSVSEIAQGITARLLGGVDPNENYSDYRSNVLIYKQLIGDLLYFLTNRKEAALKCGTEAFVDDYILGRPDIWNTADDSLKVVGLANFVKALSALAPVGSTLPSLKIPATVLSKGGEKAKKVNLRRLKNTILVFHLESCALCREEVAAAYRLIDEGPTEAQKSACGLEKVARVVLINMDQVPLEELMPHLDLSTLPLLLSTDEAARVRAKYISLR